MNKLLIGACAVGLVGIAWSLMNLGRRESALDIRANRNAEVEVFYAGSIRFVKFKLATGERCVAQYQGGITCEWMP